MQLQEMETIQPSVLGIRGFSVRQESNLEQALAGAYFAAVLLTLSSEYAEDAVQEAIQAQNGDEPLESTLILGTIKACIAQSKDQLPLTADELETVISLLPVGLHGVMRLPVHLRRCFVLRILVQLPPEACARLLCLPTQAIDRYTCAALSRLPASKARATQLIGWNLIYRRERTYYEQT